MNETLGNRIKQLRCEKGITVDMLTAALGINEEKYCKMERGDIDFSLETLMKIAGVLGVTVSDITCVLNDVGSINPYRNDKAETDEKIFEMLDLLYANKRMYSRLQNRKM